jgi:hypothetical protein
MMRQPQEIKVRPGSQKSGSTSIPAPIGGLNARDSVANMDPKDAVLLENWFPKTTSVDIRNGYLAWSTFTGVCQSILVYNSGTATKVFPCVKNGSTYSIYDGSSAGALSSAVVGGSGPTVQALTSCRFDYANFGTSGGQFMSVVNGTDSALEYDGTTWSTSGSTGATLSDLFTVGVYSTRLWYGVKNALKVWYAPTASKSGALTAFELGAVFKLGGYLNSIITVTDASNTLSDYIAFLSSEGEIVAYTGDPASTFTRVAQFRIGRPVIKGNRCWTKWGTDALVLCADGVYPIRKAIQANSRSEGLAVSDKIRNLINRDIAEHASKYGWSLMIHPIGSKLIVNVPTSEDAASYQYVMNTQTGAWCKFTGWNAFCFEVTRDTLYFGANGKMVKADTETLDGTAQITADVRQAYNYLGMRGRAKHMKMLRPILSSNGGFSMAVKIDADYKTSDVTTLYPQAGGSGNLWDATWDATWLASMSSFSKWKSAPAIGHALAIRMKIVSSNVSVSWSATDVVYEGAGIVA